MKKKSLNHWINFKARLFKEGLLQFPSNYKIFYWLEMEMKG
jgi:hypothetical protein